jgi:hypothetical protein
MGDGSLNADSSKVQKTGLDIAASCSSNWELALKLAELGVPIFPCRATPKLNAKGEVVVKAKAPLVSSPGVYRATADLNQVKAW